MTKTTPWLRLLIILLALELAAPKQAYAESLVLRCRTMFADSLRKVDHLLHLNLRRQIGGLVHSLNFKFFGQSFEGQVVTGTALGYPISVKVGPKLGRGWFGTVHQLMVLSVDPGLQYAAPQFFSNGALRPLAAKFPRLEDPLFRQHKRQGILDEPAQTTEILQAFSDLQIEPIGSPEIIVFLNDTETALIKPEIFDGISAPDIIRQSERLSPGQEIALRDQVHAKARTVYRDGGVVVDIQPGNLVWFPETERWGLYELGRTPNKDWVSDDFATYLNYFYRKAKQLNEDADANR